MPNIINHTHPEVLHADYAYHYKDYQAQKRKNNYHYFRVQVQGKCKALVENQITIVNPGELLLYQPGDIVHIMFDETLVSRRDENKKIPISGNYFISCSGEWLDEWLKRTGIPRKVKISLSESMLAICREIILEHRRQDKQNEVISKQISGHLLQVFCLMVERTYKEISKNQANESSLPAYRMKEFIVENATRKFRLEDVARDAGLSISRAVHLFKAVFQQTIMQYALEVRLSIACEYIQFTDMTLESIAELSGFGSYTYFHRAFRERYGISPKQYRTDINLRETSNRLK